MNNSIRFSAGATVNNVIGAAYFFNGADFASLDVNGFVRAANFGADANTAPLNLLISGRYSKLTTSVLNNGPVAVPGIELSGPGVNLSFGNSGNTADPFVLNGNPGTILKSGGGTSVVSGGTFATTINPQVTQAIRLNNSGQELILRADSATDVLQFDLPLFNVSTLTKSGLGQVTFTAANSYTGQTLINNGTILVTGNGVLGSATGAASVRLSGSASQTATLTIDSPTASIITGAAVNDALRIGEGGTAVMNQSAGTVTGNQYVTLGENLGSMGTYNMSGGTLSVKNTNANNPSLVVGRAGTGIFNLSGTAAISVLNGGQVQLASGAANPGQFQGMVPNVGLSTGVGTITQTGGSLTVAVNNAAYQSNIVGAVIIGVDGAGTYNLNGGTLTTPILARGNGTATFNLGGGTLKSPTAVASMPAFVLNTDLAMNLTGTGAGKGTIDTNGLFALVFFTLSVPPLIL